MHESRRTFLLALATTAGCVMADPPSLLAQRRRPFPNPPPPSTRENTSTASGDAQRQAARRLLLQNEEEFRSGVERLYQLTNELHEEIQKTVTSEVFSIRMYKRTDEIAKLAKQLKSKAKGG